MPGRDAAGDSLCVRCAREGRSCCHDSRVFVTLGDVERIRRASRRNDFYEYARADEEEYAPGARFDAVWTRIFLPDGSRRVLRHDDGGGCVFLTSSGCSLSLETRPLVCRLYPFDYNEIAVKGVYGHLCPEPECGNAPLLLAMLGMHRDSAEVWRVLLYHEIAGEFPCPAMVGDGGV